MFILFLPSRRPSSDIFFRHSRAGLRVLLPPLVFFLPLGIQVTAGPFLLSHYESTRVLQSSFSPFFGLSKFCRISRLASLV